MNKVLVEASLDLATLEANQQFTRLRSRISDENFIEFMADKWGTKYFENIQAESDNQNFVQQVNEEPIQTNTDLCIMGKWYHVNELENQREKL